MNFNLSNFQSICLNLNEESPRSFFSLTSKLRFSPRVTLLVYVIYLFPFCFGVFGNLSVCLIFFQQRKLRSITNTFLMNLCLNDLIVLCVSTPMTLSAALLENWIFGTFLCKLVHFTSTLTALISTFTVAVIAVERWFFIVNKQKFDRLCTIFTLVFLWIISILIALPEFLSRQVQEIVSQALLQYMINTYQSMNTSTNSTPLRVPCPIEKTSYCVLKPGLRMRIFSYIIMTVQYLVPFLFVSISCYSISRYLRHRMKRMRIYQPHHQRQVKSNSRNKSKNHNDEITEQELTSCDDLPLSNSIQQDLRSTYSFFTRFRHRFQSRDDSKQRNSLNMQDQHQYLKSQSHTERRFRRSRKLLICVAALFTISWLPLTIIQIYLDHNEEILLTRDGANYVYGYLLIPCYLISSLSAWMNPVIYNYINRSFRREFYSLYSCCFSRFAKNENLQKEITSLPKNRPQADNSKTLHGRTAGNPTRISSKTPPHAVSFLDQSVVLMHEQNY